MGMSYKEQGGGAATGLADTFIRDLQRGLQTGSFGASGATSQFNGANPVGSTQGIWGTLNDILSSGGGKIGGSYQDMITKQGDRDALALRSRFGVGGGTAFGTPGAYGEALLRSETAPKLVSAIGGLQENAINSLLPIIAGLSQKGITQREGAYQPSPWLQAAQLGLQGAGEVASIYAGAPGAGIKRPSGGGGGFNPSLSANQVYDPSLFNAPSPAQWGQTLSGSSGYASSGNWMPQGSPLFGYTPNLQF